jgi:uncharacterized protein (DUF885 family)
VADDFGRTLRRGVGLFNRGRFFAAHEAWEEAWRGATGDDRRLLQGLVQAAAAFVKLERGAPRGASGLFAKAAARVEGVPAAGTPVDLARLSRDLARWRAFAARRLRSGNNATGLPAARLHVLAPKRPRPVGRRRAAVRDGAPAGRAFRDLVAADWEWRLREYPTFATVVGDPRYDDRWQDLSPEARSRRDGYYRDLLRRLEKLDRGSLPVETRTDHDLLLYETRLAVEELRFHDELMPLSQMNGVHQDIADLLQISPRRTIGDLEKIAARLRASGTLIDQTIALMREGLARGVTPPRIVLRSVPDQITAQIADDPAATPIAAVVLRDLPADLDGTALRRVRDGILAAVRDVVVPAYRRLHAFVEKEYLPRSRTTVGLSALPDGEAWYAHRVRLMTSRDLSPRAIHDIGLAEVTRLRAAMKDTMRAAGHEGDLRTFLEFLRTDPRFFLGSREHLLMAYRDICKRLDAALPRLFRTLPRLPYGVVPVPPYSEKEQTTAYYHPGSPEAGRPGYFYANTYDLKARPTWEMEALAAHEAVPGHHLQIALAQELGGLPNFRRYGHHTAFIEGWGLYSESLGSELGLYGDPYSSFGRLTYEMWRAIRLVVDTGLHALGWTRDQAIGYFEENAGKAGHDIVVEVDRYIAWPGQALAYKLGELTFRELRERARQALGRRFDIRDFHDTVLLAGPLPLPILERRVEEWMSGTACMKEMRA